MTSALWHFDQNQLPLRYDTTNEKQRRPSECYSRWSCHSIRGGKNKSVWQIAHIADKSSRLRHFCSIWYTNPLGGLGQSNRKLDRRRHRLQTNCKRNHWLFLNKPIKLVKINISHRGGFFFVCSFFSLSPNNGHCVSENNSFWSAGGAARSKTDERERTRWLLLLRRLQPEVLTHILVTY